MPDDILPIGSITITIGIDINGKDITEVELDNTVSILQALGAIQIAQRDLLDSIDISERHDED